MFIISAVLVCLVGLGIIGYNVEKNKAAENDDTKVEDKVDEVTEEEEKLELNIDKFDISKIEGYTPGQDITSENNTLEDTSQDNSNITVGGINLPYSIPNRNMEIISIGSYSGKFVEDGSDANKDNILSIVVKNTSEKVIEYGEITMKISGKSETIKFKVTNLKPGACDLVMESTGKVEFNPDDKYIYLSSKNNMINSMSTMESKVSITTENKNITLENLSDENLNTVYVYYKNISEGNCYLGGITYRAKFENVEAGKSITINTIHFSSTNSEILKIESVKK